MSGLPRAVVLASSCLSSSVWTVLSVIGYEFWVVLAGTRICLDECYGPFQSGEYGYLDMTICLLLWLFSSVEGELKLHMSKSNFSKAASFGSYSKQYLIENGFHSPENL